MSTSNEPPKNDKNASGHDAIQQPNRPPTRVIHNPKTGTHSGEASRRRISLFKPRPASSSQIKTQSETPAEGTDKENLPISGDSSGMSSPGASLNPDQRLRMLENAGKDSPPDLPPEPPLQQSAGIQPSPTQSSPRKVHLITFTEKTHHTIWDVGLAISLLVNVILLMVIFSINSQMHDMTNNLDNLLGGMFNNFVRMDNSVISTTITMPDVPIPVNFNLPVVQPDMNVTLTHSFTIKSAHVTISSGALTINNAPATVTLPEGTILPVSLQMDVPVQTTVMMNLQVPVNIKLSEANSADTTIGNLHTAFLGLQDAIGPLYCHFNPMARDYLDDQICNAQGVYMSRSAASNP